MDKVKFRNAKAKPYSNKAVSWMIDKGLSMRKEQKIKKEDDEALKRKKRKQQSLLRK